jgi:hypothetical protein
MPGDDELNDVCLELISTVEIPLRTCESIFVVSMRDVLASKRVTSLPCFVARQFIKVLRGTT